MKTQFTLICSEIVLAFLLSISLIVGCGERNVTGGTPGTLTIAGEKLPEIRLDFHRIEGDKIETVGFAVTNAAGEFRLLKPGATGKLYLPDGEYRITIESIGPEINLPVEYLAPKLTPLQLSWKSSTPELKLDVSPPSVAPPPVIPSPGTPPAIIIKHFRSTDPQ